MTRSGVFLVALANTSSVMTASGSTRYTIRQSLLASFTRSTWQRGPMIGMGREWDMGRFSPSWTLRTRPPASSLASAEKGGVLIFPRSQTSDLLGGLMGSVNICQNGHIVKVSSNKRLKLAARGRPAADGRLRTRAAA